MSRTRSAPRTRRAFVASAGSALALSSIALAACAPTGRDSAPSAEKKALPPARLTAQIGGSQGTYDLLQSRQFPAFAERFPGVTVDFTPGNITLERLRTLAAAGDTPDLYMAGPAYTPAVSQDRLAVPLDERLKAWGKQSDFFASSMAAPNWQGKQWGLPMMVANRTHLWRKNVLTETGIAKTPGTWDEVVDAARRATRAEGTTLLREGNPKPDTWTYLVTSLLSVGKTLFRDGRAEFADAEGTAALEYALDLYQAVRPAGATPAAGSDAVKFGTGAQPHTWANMTAVREVLKSSPQEIEQVVVADPPVPGSGKYRVPAGAKIRPVSLDFTDWIGIGSSSKAPDHAWELMKFLIEPDQLLAYCETRYFQPPRKSIANQGFMKQPFLQRMVEVFDKHGHPQIRVPDQTVFITVLREMGETVFTGKASAKQAVEEAARLLQAETDRLGFKGTTL